MSATLQVFLKLAQMSCWPHLRHKTRVRRLAEQEKVENCVHAQEKALERVRGVDGGTLTRQGAEGSLARLAVSLRDDTAM